MIFLRQSAEPGPIARPMPSCCVAVSSPTIRSNVQAHSHKCVINRDNKHLARVLELGAIHVRRDMAAGAGTRERGRDADNVSVTGLKLFGQIDLVTWRVLVEHLDIGDRVADLDESAGRGVEATRGRGANKGRNATERRAEGHGIFSFLVLSSKDVAKDVDNW